MIASNIIHLVLSFRVPTKENAQVFKKKKMFVCHNPDRPSNYPSHFWIFIQVSKINYKKSSDQLVSL